MQIPEHDPTSTSSPSTASIPLVVPGTLNLSIVPSDDSQDQASRSERRTNGESLRPELIVYGPLTRIYAGKLFDSEMLDFLENRVITVSEKLGLVVDVRPFEEGEFDAEVRRPGDAKVVDLREKAVLPGFVDTHVHCELDYGSYAVHNLLIGAWVRG